uniref:Uncharacterized protein n=1 Tax=Oryza brachyantha TaxID=4533 RepID=J3L4H0_ORYBR
QTSPPESFGAHVHGGAHLASNRSPHHHLNSRLDCPCPSSLTPSSSAPSSILGLQPSKRAAGSSE